MTAEPRPTSSTSTRPASTARPGRPAARPRRRQGGAQHGSRRHDGDGNPLAGLAGGLSRVPLVLVSVAHAPVSEWLQGSVLPHRSADWRDVLADLAGIVVAVALWPVIGGQDRARSGARSGT